MGDVTPIDGSRLCDANLSRGRGKCKQPAGAGTDHLGFGRCKFHGGHTPAGEKNGQRLMAEHACAKLGVPRQVDPQQALLEEVWRCAGNVAFYESIVKEMGYDAERPNAQFGGANDALVTTRFGEMTPSVWINLYNDERKAMVSAAAWAIKCGVAERQVRLAEQQGALVNAAFNRLLADPELGLTAKQKAKAPTAVVRALRLVTEEAS